MNDSTAWLQLALYVALLLLITKPLGLYLMRVLDRARAHLAGPGRWADRAPHLPPLPH